MRVGVYPGTFNPPTIAHVAVAAAARTQRNLDRVVLMVSTRPINKEHVDRPLLADRLAVLRAVAACTAGGWLDVGLTEHRLLVDIARGYDVLIMGADKWDQVIDPQYYDDDEARDAAVAALPELAIARRAPFNVPARWMLDVDAAHEPVSSTAAREGIREWMCAPAADFDDRTGAWTDPSRYEHWLRQ